MIDIKVNGEKVCVESGISVLNLLEMKNYDSKKVAIEMNGDILPKAQYEITVIKSGDVLEIVSFVGGG